VSIDPISVIVLAGGMASEELMAATGCSNRALITIGDLTMLDLVVRALLGAKSVNRIYVVGDVPKSGDYEQVDPRGDLLQNLTAGVDRIGLSYRGPILVATSDIPFLTPESVDDFIAQGRERRAQICYPIIPMDVYNLKFEGMKRTTLRTKEGRFTGGNLMLLDAGFVARHGSQIRQAYAARKDVLKLGTILGPKILLRILFSQTVAPDLLPLAILEEAVSRLLDGANVAAVVTNYPEIGTDVDKVADVEYARQHFGV